MTITWHKMHYLSFIQAEIDKYDTVQIDTIVFAEVDEVILFNSSLICSPGEGRAENQTDSNVVYFSGLN